MQYLDDFSKYYRFLYFSYKRVYICAYFEKNI